MEKIEVYDMFEDELGLFHDIDPIVNALDYCRKEALEHKDRDIIDLMLTRRPYLKVDAMLERERQGERCIPDYLWKAMGKWIRDMNTDWLKQAKFFGRPPKLIDKEMDELKEINKQLREAGFPFTSCFELCRKKLEMDPARHRCEIGCADPVNKYYFRHVYFRDRVPCYKKQNYRKQLKALKDLSERHLRFAKMFEE